MFLTLGLAFGFPLSLAPAAGQVPIWPYRAQPLRGRTAGRARPAPEGRRRRQAL